ncbi:MRN complex-interacting protein isoform X3 [Hippoglossus stenolepis]|uniref:MRN complex-interacting protein isoform X3 n=1 Tax=Hippoglossus stenolepis TaxID=195615 RepID=UPI001FAE8F1B|nr:MRN complex-interacting protein isoform X3 [Hippoglossus stenolepis]
MVQEFHVVRCFTCEKFQVQQVRGSLSALLRVCQVRGSLSALLRVCQVRGSLSALLRVCQVRGSLSALLRVCQVKKATRWSCKVCGEKQSLLKEFGRGSGADCRRHVQKLNAMIGAVVEEQEESPWEPEEEKNDQVTVTQTQVSRWSKYMETPEEAELEEEQQLHGNNMTDREEIHPSSSAGTLRNHQPEPAVPPSPVGPVPGHQMRTKGAAAIFRGGLVSSGVTLRCRSHVTQLSMGGVNKWVGTHLCPVVTSSPAPAHYFLFPPCLRLKTISALTSFN